MLLSSAYSGTPSEGKFPACLRVRDRTADFDFDPDFAAGDFDFAAGDFDFAAGDFDFAAGEPDLEPDFDPDLADLYDDAADERKDLADLYDDDADDGFLSARRSLFSAS